MEKRGLNQALRTWGLLRRHRILYTDEMRVGLWGQVRRVWGIRGTPVIQKVQIVFDWVYLLLGVNPQTGRLQWSWVERMRQEYIAPALEKWSVDALVWDNASSHKGYQVADLGLSLIFLPPYSPELSPPERIFRELRPKIEGQPYPSLRAKQLTVEHHLRQLAAHREQVKRLTNWDWIQEAHAGLPQS